MSSKFVYNFLKIQAEKNDVVNLKIFLQNQNKFFLKEKILKKNSSTKKPFLTKFKNLTSINEMSYSTEKKMDVKKTSELKLSIENLKKLKTQEKAKNILTEDDGNVSDRKNYFFNSFIKKNEKTM